MANISRRIEQGGRSIVEVLESEYTVDNKDYYILVNYAGACTINFPTSANVQDGKVFKIKDISGNASSNNITLSAGTNTTINGGSSLDITEDFGKINIVLYNNNFLVETNTNDEITNNTTIINANSSG